MSYILFMKVTSTGVLHTFTPRHILDILSKAINEQSLWYCDSITFTKYGKSGELCGITASGSNYDIKNKVKDNVAKMYRIITSELERYYQFYGEKFEVQMNTYPENPLPSFSTVEEILGENPLDKVSYNLKEKQKERTSINNIVMETAIEGDVDDDTYYERDDYYS